MTDRRPSFDRTDLTAFLTTLGVGLAVYVWAMAPTVTLEDSGELIVAAHYLGVPHPPGYPIWTVLAWGIQRLFGFMTFRGHPNPAWGVNFTSALFGALACANLALLICRSGRDLLAPEAGEPGPARRLAPPLAGIAAGLTLAFTQVLWSQSMIAEVYSLNAAFLTGILLAAYAWLRRPGDDRWLLLTCFLFGLGVTNHQTLLFVALALAAVVFFARPPLFRDLAVLSVGLGAVLLVMTRLAPQIGPGLHPLAGPAGTGFWLVLFANGLLLGAVWAWLPEGRTAAAAMFVFQLGLAFYVYMPLASEQNPPMNWGYARTWEGFLHAVSRGQYERIEPTELFSRRFVDQIGLYLSDLRRQFTLPVLLLGFLPFTRFRIRTAERWHGAHVPALVLIGAATVLTVLEDALTPGEIAGTVPPINAAYRLCVLLVMVLAMMGGLVLVLELIRDQIRAFPAHAFSVRLTWTLVGLGAGLLALGVMGGLIWEALQAGLAWEDRLLLGVVAFCPPAILGVGGRLLARDQVAFDAPPRARAWLFISGVAFLAVSLILIYFLNQDLDIQTLFIGRVQFIQSHVVYAVWIGYGLLVALDLLLRLRPGPGWRTAVAVAALALPAFTFSRDWWDAELLRIYGASRQRGHDFGWQFGVYALEGAEAIRRDLRPDEPPLPDPDYPPPMEPGAVFFGGTDPGRFVPTYFLFSGGVRPDVFLLTQNALADRSYVQAMRDLYGDTLWIPSDHAHQLAFERYRREIQEGKFPPSLQLLEETPDGLRVTGSAGVMIINGYLSQVMFGIHKRERAFYVEESTPIPWMKPHLVPHGLIMRIEPEPLDELPEARVAQDRRFWAWYTRRLLDDPRFVRDVAARRSFSKLRTALAGLYAHRELWEHADAAYEEAVALYPLAPEPYFRWAEALVRQQRFDEALATMETFFALDPGHHRGQDYLIHLASWAEADRIRQEIAARDPADRTPEEWASLVHAHLLVSDGPVWRKLVMDLVSEEEPDPVVLRVVGHVLSQHGQANWEVLTLRRYLDHVPGDPRAWTDFAAALLAQGRTDDALGALERAVAVGGRPIQDALRRDRRFTPLHGHPRFRALVPLPGRSGVR